MKLDIYSKEGQLKISAIPESNNAESLGIQEESTLALSFTGFSCIPLEVYDYTEFQGRRYWVIERYVPKMNARREWAYAISLFGVEGFASQTLMVNPSDDDNPVLTLSAPAREHAALIVANLNRKMGTTDWRVGEVVVSEYIDIEYTGKYASDVLSELSEAAGTEWWFDGMTLNVSRCEFGELVPLSYGDGLLGGISRSTADGVKFFTRLFPVGSSRNIDADRYGHARLQLPDGARYVEQDTHLGIIEHFEQEAFAEIYPRRIGVVGTVRHEEVTGDDGDPFTIWYFTDPDIPFDPNEYEIGGLVKRITFQSGELRGREFEVNYDTEKKEFEIITQWPYGDEMQLPSEPMIPVSGDEYILWNIRMPDSYYPAAEQEYKEAVDRFMADNRKDVAVYEAPTDFTVIERRALDLRPGQRVRLVSSEAFPDTGFRDTRIVSISRSVARPGSMTLKMSDVLSTGRISRIESNLATVERMTRQVTAEFPDLIRSWEETPASDTTVYSSRKCDREFLSRRRGGTVQENVTFDKDVAVGGAVVSKDFRQGDFSGSGFGFYFDANGNAVGEVDIIKARKEAVFNTAIINQVTFQIGATVFSNGGCKIARVEELDDVYRCYYDTKDGRRLCGLVAYDQARCQHYDPSQNRIIKYYWRLVMNVGNDYVDLSKTFVDGSGIPEVGDEIAQFGNQTDKTRQSATIIDPQDGSSVVVYSQIDSFSLSKKNYVGLGTNPQTGRAYLFCYGDFFLGDRELKDQFLTFQIPEGQTVPQLFAKMNISLGSGSSGLTNLTEWAEKQQQIDTATELSQALDSTVSNLTNNIIPDLQKQVDGQIVAYNGTYAPTLTNYPAVDWTTDTERTRHINDYFDRKITEWSDINDTSMWESGNVTGGGSGDYYEDVKNDSQLVIRMVTPLPAIKGSKFSVSDGFLVRALALDEELIVNHQDNFSQETTMVYACSYIALSICKSSYANMSVSELADANLVCDIVSSDTSDVSYERYKFVYENNTYQWVRIADSGAAEAQAKALEALGVANGKNKIYFGDATPNPPYIINDIWINTRGEILISNKNRGQNETAVISDWQLVNDAQLRIRQMASDSVISREEKPTLRNRLAQMQKEYASYQADASAYAVSISALQTAYTNLTSFLTGTVAVNSDTDTTLSSEQRTAYNTYFAAYDTEVSRFTNLVADAISQGKVDGIKPDIEKAQKAADAAKEAADAAKKDAENNKNRLEIIQSDGYVSAVEKRSLKLRQADMQTEYPQIVAEAEEYGLSKVEGPFQSTPEYWEQGSANSQYTGYLWEDMKFESTKDIRTQMLLYAFAKAKFSVGTGFMVQAVCFGSDKRSISKTSFAQSITITDENTKFVSLIIAKTSDVDIVPDELVDAALIVSVEPDEITNAANWEQGTIEGKEGQSYADDKYGTMFYMVRLKNLVSTPVGKTVSIGGPYQFRLTYYDADGLCTGVTDYWPLEGDITSGHSIVARDYPYMAVVIRKLNSAGTSTMNLTPSDIASSGFTLGDGSSGGGDVPPSADDILPVEQPSTDHVTGFEKAYNAANAALTKYTASTPENIPTESDFGDIYGYYTARQIILDAIADAVKAHFDAMSDYEYLKEVFPNMVLDSNGVFLSRLMAVKDSAEADAAVVAGMYGGGVETLNNEGFRDPTHGTLMFFAGATDVQNAAAANTRIYGDGSLFTKKLYANGGEIGGFTISEDKLVSGNYDVGEEEMTLSKEKIRFRHKGTSGEVYIGVNNPVLPPSLGAISCLMSVENKNPSSDNRIGILIEVDGNLEALLPDRVNAAVWAESGSFVGFRPRSTYVESGQTNLDYLDSVVYVNTSSGNAVLTLPTNPQPDQMYMIRKLYAANSVSVGSSSHRIYLTGSDTPAYTATWTGRRAGIIQYNRTLNAWVLMFTFEA